MPPLSSLLLRQWVLVRLDLMSPLTISKLEGWVMLRVSCEHPGYMQRLDQIKLLSRYPTEKFFRTINPDQAEGYRRVNHIGEFR